MPRIRLTLTVYDKDGEWGVSEAVKLYGDNAVDVLKDEIEKQFERFYDQAEIKLEVIGGSRSRGIKQSNNSESPEHGDPVLPVQG